jgi:hypothetical protein
MESGRPEIISFHKVPSVSAHCAAGAKLSYRRPSESHWGEEIKWFAYFWSMTMP